MEKGTATLKTGSLYPYDIIREALNNTLTAEERIALDLTWRNFPDYGTSENALAVIDGSGSMTWSVGSPKPIEAALSLGIYFAEHNRGAFANHFITFSNRPQLVEIKGNDIYEKTRYAASYNEVANTDLEAVFYLLLTTAKKYHLSQNDLPKTLYIISDMEFDTCVQNSSVTNFEHAKRLFQSAGYNLPNIVFWNVNSRSEQVPVRMNENGVALVSGSTPKIFEMVQSGELNPMKLMLEIIEKERYQMIAA